MLRTPLRRTRKRRPLGCSSPRTICWRPFHSLITTFAVCPISGSRRSCACTRCCSSARWFSGGRRVPRGRGAQRDVPTQPVAPCWCIAARRAPALVSRNGGGPGVRTTVAPGGGGPTLPARSPTLGPPCPPDAGCDPARRPCDGDRRGRDLAIYAREAGVRDGAGFGGQ